MPVDTSSAQQLQQEIERIHQSLASLSISKASELEILQSTLALKDEELSELRQQCYQLTLQLQQKQQKAESYSAQLSELHQLTQSLQSELKWMSKKGTKTELQKFLKGRGSANEAEVQQGAMIGQRVMRAIGGWKN